MQVDKTHFPMHMVEVGAPAVLIRPEQADKAQGKNMIIGEPRVAPNVKTNSGRKVVLKKDDEGKNKLKITAESTQYLKRQRWYETTVAQQRPARPTPPVGQANSSTQQGQLVQPTQGVSLADSATTSAKSAKPTAPVGLANSPGSNSSGASGVRVLRTFVPQRPEIGTWKTNEKKNLGEFVKKQCTFDKLMAKYKQQKADS